MFLTLEELRELRAHYAKTALARMGVPFERGMQITPVRIAVEGAAAAARHSALKGLIYG